MKEQMTYVAIDADNVGESVGNAVLSNDTEQLSSISESINSGVSIFSQWAEYNGGKVISSGSDEAIFQVPIQSLDDLEKLKQEYQDKTGFSISIGIGENVSDAAKALIYAKMNGKDQIMDYSPEMERAMKQSLSGELTEEVTEENEKDKLPGGKGDDAEAEDFPQDELEEGTEHEMEHTDDPEIAEEIAEDHLTESDDYYSDLDEMEAKDKEEETEEIDVPADQVDGDYGSEEMEEAQPEHEKEMGEEEEFIHDAEENREDELDDDIIEADEEEALMEDEGEVSEDEALEEMVEDDSAGEDIDLDGKPDEMEEHGEIDPEQDDLDEDGDVEHEEAMAAEAEAEYDDTGDYEDEIADAEMDEEEAMDEDADEDLQNAIAQEMGVEEEAPEEMMEEAPMEEPGAEEPLDHEGLKEVIYESLNIFRQNREYLNAMAQENPELYSSLIHTLQAMIEMAKELGYGDAAEELEAEEPSMEDEALSDEDETMNPEALEMEDEEQEDMQEEDESNFEKTESFHKLVAKMRKTFEMFKAADDVKTMEEVKEAIKKKKEQSKKGGGKKVSKKRKPTVKKPKIPGKKKKKTEDKGDNDGSFCAKSHKKMRAAGKDCRSNEDKNSPLCSARKKFNCRGKNEEKSKTMDKSEKLSRFLKKKDKKELEKGREGTATKQTTRHVSKPHHAEGTQKGYKVKVIDNETGEAKWIDGSRGLAKDPQGDPIGPSGKSPVSTKKQVVPKLGKE